MRALSTEARRARPSIDPDLVTPTPDLSPVLSRGQTDKIDRSILFRLSCTRVGATTWNGNEFGPEVWSEWRRSGAAHLATTNPSDTTRCDSRRDRRQVTRPLALLECPIGGRARRA